VLPADRSSVYGLTTVRQSTVIPTRATALSRRTRWGQMKTTTAMTWVDVPTRTIEVEGVPFAYRDLGPVDGVPVVFLHHLMAVLDDWDPRVIDGIAAHHRVIAFDNRGV